MSLLNSIITHWRNFPSRNLVKTPGKEGNGEERRRRERGGKEKERRLNSFSQFPGRELTSPTFILALPLFLFLTLLKEQQEVKVGEPQSFPEAERVKEDGCFYSSDYRINNPSLNSKCVISYYRAF